MLIELYKMLNNKSMIDQLLVVVSLVVVLLLVVLVLVDPQVFHVHLLVQLVQMWVIQVQVEVVVLVLLFLKLIDQSVVYKQLQVLEHSKAVVPVLVQHVEVKIIK